MGLEQIWLLEKLIKRFKMKPIRASLEVGFLLIMFIAICYFGAGYLPEKGRQLASDTKPTKTYETKDYSKTHNKTIGSSSVAAEKEHNVPRGIIILIGIITATTIAIYVFWIIWSKKKVNKKAISKALRPSRLKVYNTTRDFLHFCTTYWTKHCQGMVKGTNDLMNKLDSFKNSIKSEGPLNMPSVEGNIKEVIKKTWKLQRLIDRIAILRPPNQDYYDIEDNIHALVDWFAQQEKDIEKLFEPCLKL